MMTRTMVSGVFALGITLGAGSAFAGPNCNQVNKYLGTGRTPEDVADTMVVSLEDVKKCQQEAAKGGAAPGAAAAPAGGAASPPAAETKDAPKK